MTTEPLGPSQGVDERLVADISSLLGEPEWAAQSRLNAVGALTELSAPHWWQADRDGDLDRLLISPEPSRRWGTGHRPAPDRLPPSAPVGPAAAAQAEAEAIFQERLEMLEQDGVVFCDLATAVTRHPDLVRPHLGRLVTAHEDKLVALTAALWAGGTFLYVPPGLRIEVPLQSYARARSESPDRFEWTLILADEDSSVHYIEGCASPVYTTDTVRSAAVEVVVKPSAEVVYTTVQNWSANVTDVSRTAAEVEAGGCLRWTAGNIGARRTVRRLTVDLAGDGAVGEARTVSYAGRAQSQTTNVEMNHAAPVTRSLLISRSVADGDGRVEHRDRILADDRATKADATTDARGMILDEVATVAITEGGTETTSERDDGTLAVSEEQRFYLMSRGLSKRQATALLVNGFIDPVITSLPTEYAVEWNRLIELQLQGAIG